MLKKPIDEVEVKLLKEDLAKCKEILNKMNLTAEKGESYTEELYFKVKSKGFNKEMLDIDKILAKNNRRNLQTKRV